MSFQSARFDACSIYSLLLLTCCSEPAIGDNCPNGVIPEQCSPVGTCLGPDVIAGDLSGVANYASEGGIEAFALAATACNIGNAQVNWVGATPEHPVLSQTMFKLKTLANGVTTFEQIGQSWVYHESSALSEALCCTGCQAADGSHLGVHCSSPHSASIIGTQTSLGPKWEVNAHSAIFPFPHANPTFTGSIARRLQVAIGDLEVSSATVRYFGAAQFVSPDDAAASNQDNNETYRPLTVTGSGSAWSANFSGTAQRTQQAIRAWGDTVPTVHEAQGSPAGDGLFILAEDVTALPGGSWHYEYAIQNMNSHQGGQSFSVPVPAGVSITNVGFHDVAYHSGDGPGNLNVSGVDWAAVVAGGAITWSTETFAQNQSANALRWGTLYNFRFDATAPPMSGNVTLGLFRPGIESWIALSTRVPAVPYGDLNCDNVVNTLDVAPFVLALIDATGYGQQFPSCSILRADANADSNVNGRDIAAMVDVLIN